MSGYESPLLQCLHGKQGKSLPLLKKLITIKAAYLSRQYSHIKLQNQWRYYGKHKTKMNHEKCAHFQWHSIHTEVREIGQQVLKLKGTILIHAQNSG